MSVNKRASEIAFDLKPSRALLSAVCVIFVLAMVALWVAQLDLWIKLVLMAVLSVSMVYTIRTAQLQLQGAIVSIQSMSGERAWLLTTRNNHQFKAVQRNARVYRHLVVLDLFDKISKRKQSVFIAADALSFDQHRQLRAMAISIQASGDY